MRDGRTEVRSPDRDALRDWLEEFTVGGDLAEESARRTPVIRLAVSVEGETEEDFVNGTLAPHLQRMRIRDTDPAGPGPIPRRRRWGCKAGETCQGDAVPAAQFQRGHLAGGLLRFRDKGPRTADELFWPSRNASGNATRRSYSRTFSFTNSRVCCSPMYVPSGRRLMASRWANSPRSARSFRHRRTSTTTPLPHRASVSEGSSPTIGSDCMAHRSQPRSVWTPYGTSAQDSMCGCDASSPSTNFVREGCGGVQPYRLPPNVTASSPAGNDRKTHPSR